MRSPGALAAVIAKLAAGAAHDPALAAIVSLLEPARIQIDEAARALRALSADARSRPRASSRASTSASRRSTRSRASTAFDRRRCPELLADTEARLAALAESADAAMLAKRAADAEARYRALARQLSAKREFAAHELETRVTEAMQQLAMAGGRLEIALEPLAAPAAYGQEQVEFRVASHPKQPLGPLARVASGGELSRIALAIQVVTSEVAAVPTLVFDEVDAGIGGAVAATVGRLLQSLGARRQVLCVTHLPQVATFADAHFRVTKRGDAAARARRRRSPRRGRRASRSSRGCWRAARSPPSPARTRRSSSSSIGGGERALLKRGRGLRRGGASARLMMRRRPLRSTDARRVAHATVPSDGASDAARHGGGPPRRVRRRTRGAAARDRALRAGA